MEASGLLAAGRQAFENIRGRVGLSASSRQQLEGFFNNATVLFNTLYTSAENQELNNIRTIMALRAKHSGLVSETVSETAASTTSGTNVDTSA